ncbi:DUF4012 domain-containing protein [Nocardioides soli]|uniref:DUF4012 domain-containing protein n=1 Tax=Nocardioides soli TaxID=1036020 RepID=A0A7W4Z0F1_9ACTN|nr:hypothetical protein [Nocardioides soli]
MNRRALWIGLAVLVGAVVLFAAWAAWTTYQVNRDLTAAVDDATALRAAVEGDDDDAVQASLGRLRDHSAAAADRTAGLTWSVLEHLPAYGDDARGVAVASAVARDLADAGVEPLVRVSDDLDLIVPAQARIDVAALEALQDPVAAGRAAFDDARARLVGEDSTGYVERLRTKYRELTRQVDDAAAILSSADTALRVLPTMLGSDGPQDYLLVFQNNAEIRATGGLPGAVSVVRADDGQVRMTRQVAANTFGRTDRPVLPLTDSEEAVYNEILGTYFLDANLQPDFSRASDLWRARWEQVYPERLDGVLSVDPVAISYLLGATGPVEVGGVTLTEDNAVDELLSRVYQRFPDPAAQDRWFRRVARTVFDKVSTGVGSPQELVRAIADGVREHRVFVHSFDDSLQEAIAGKAVAGDLVTDPDAAPQVGFYLNDGTASKMSYYLRYDVSVDATYCNQGVQGLAGHATLMSDAPEDAASLPDYVTGSYATYGGKPGSQLVQVYIYGPVGGQISALALNGKPLRGPGPILDQGRPVLNATLLLDPQEKVDLTWRMKTGANQTGDIRVSVTPRVGSGSTSMPVDSAC